MEIQLLVPSQNQKRVLIQVAKDEQVAIFRKLVAQLVKVSETSFLLIAFGKIMLNKSAEKKAARLFSTYRIRHRTCVFVHIYPTTTDNKTAPEPLKTTTTTTTRGQKTVTTRSSKQPKLRTTTRGITTTTTTTTVQTLPPPLQRRSIIRDNSIMTRPFGDFLCPICQNDEKLKKCSECGCTKCLYKTGDPLICDQCDNYWHMECAGLRRMPNEHYWFCPDCINQDTKAIVGKGKAVNETSLKRTQVIAIRDMECVIVPPYHIGKIPGIYCGQSWEFRNLVHDWGVHRSTIPCVAGSMYTGAVSLVLSGGLKRDRDDGYEFIFSGGGGQLRSKGHYTMNEGQMTQDQELTRYNKALAITCYAPFNDQKGAKAIDWRKSRPIRVCRASNRKATHPLYAPKQGIRYDGLYKIVKYWPQRDKKTGFLVWKFLFRRDDQESPPWMSQGKQYMTKRGIRMITSTNETTAKLVRYTIPNRIQKLIHKDIKNKRVWDQINQMEFWSEYEFLHYLFDIAFACSSHVCSKPIKDLITTPCGHICCTKCLIKSQTEYCFTCRSPLPPLDSISTNNVLVKILQKLNWAYNPSSSSCITTNYMKEKDQFNPVKQDQKLEYLDNNNKQKQLKKRVDIFIESLDPAVASLTQKGNNRKRRRIT